MRETTAPQMRARLRKVTNMATFKVEWAETKQTTTGKTKKELSFEGGTKATIWGDFPGFDGIMPGSVIEGDLVPAKDPKYAPTLYPPRAPRASSGRAADMKVAQAMKAENIRAAQENKEQGIKIAAIFRDATLITIEMAKAIAEPMTPQEKAVWFKKTHREVREWLDREWEGDRSEMPL